MEVLINFVAGALVNLVTCVCSCVNNAIKFQSDLDSLKTELKNLENQRDTVKAEVEQAEIDGLHDRTDEVKRWLHKVDNEVNSIQSKLEEFYKKRNQFKLVCCLLGTTEEMADLLTQVKQLITQGNFPSGCLVVENNQPIRVDHLPGPSIENQSTALENLSKVLNLLNKDGVRRIGVWGMGGVGKTTLVKNLNNMLKNSSSTTTQPFSIVIWVTVSQNFDLKGVQTQIANRLNLPVVSGVNEGVERMASKIYNSLNERSFVLILDDVWKRIDLECLGIPLPEQHKYSCKVILTSRSLDVCRRMETDENVRVRILSDDESWKLFASKAGHEVATLTHIEPLAKQITRECQGLPLAIIIVGASMRKKTLPELWEDALNALRRPTPLNLIIGIEEDVYKPLKWSYDSLPGMDLKYCFLYCCLYPEDFRIGVKELVHCWLAEGFIDDEVEENYEASYNRGIALVEYLKDCCLLEEPDEDESYVKMHDVVRDVAIRIASYLEDEHGFHVQSGIRLAHIHLHKLSKSLKRVSFMDNRITSLPNCAAIQFPHISTLLLQNNRFLENVEKGFLLGFPALKILNLSNTNIRTLPLTLLKCSKLQALFLRHCSRLVKIPSLAGLISLKMIDLSDTAIEELPKGMETLTNLKQLFLSGTKRLNKIRVGIISQLKSLEILDMTQSACKWAVVRVGEREGKGEASFHELGCLTQLSVLKIQLDVSCLSIDPPCWLSELNKFQFFVGTSVGSSYSTESKIDERRATLLHLHNFRNTWSLGPLQCATSMWLNNCEGFEQNPENFCFTNLRSLSIWETHLFKGENEGNHVASRHDLLPNLEEIFLIKVEGIESISDLAGHFGLRLEKLRVIGVGNCENLKFVFSVGSLGLALESLEEVRVHYCDNVVDLFRCCESSSQTSALVDTYALNLKLVKLNHLQRLETLLSKPTSYLSLPKLRLERLEVINCGLLKKLPFTAQIANAIKEIRGEPRWWDQLEWDDDDTKSNLQQYFTPR